VPVQAGYLLNLLRVDAPCNQHDHGRNQLGVLVGALGFRLFSSAAQAARAVDCLCAGGCRRLVDVRR
jgi:hypothetical protein